MTNSDTVDGTDPAPSLREVWALKQAVELLGFDADALVRRMCESSESYWQRLALSSACISFAAEQAYTFDSHLSSAALAAAEGWLASVRLAAPIATPELLAAAEAIGGCHNHSSGCALTNSFRSKSDEAT